MPRVRHIAVALRRQGESLPTTQPSFSRQGISTSTRHGTTNYLQHEECV